MTGLLDERVTVVEGIAFADSGGGSAYRERWEQEATEDHVRSAIANAPGESTTDELLTGKISPLWSRFPENQRVETLLDLGAGYGRIDLYLAREKGLACNTFFAVDISETMLRKLLEYRERYSVFADAHTVAVCASADDLPLADQSVDLVISSAVFLHMGKRFVERAIGEVARGPQTGWQLHFRRGVSQQAQSIELAPASQAGTASQPERAQVLDATRDRARDHHEWALRALRRIRGAGRRLCSAAEAPWATLRSRRTEGQHARRRAAAAQGFLRGLIRRLQHWGVLVARVLVTGGGGFLGSHLVPRLNQAGHDVFVARRDDYDLTRFEDAQRLFSDSTPELVFHLAAEVGGIGANRDNPGRYWYANLMMGAHVLELSRIHEVGKLVIAGTVCAYPKFAPVPFTEDDLWNGYPEETNAPYGVAKKAVLVGAQAYREQYGTDAIFLLPANLYGPRDNFDLSTSHVIPALIRKMVDANREVVLWGDGSPTREFLYVDDCAEGLLLASARYDSSEPANLGTGRRDFDPRARRDDRRAHRLRRRDRLGYVDAERTAAPPARFHTSS